MRPAGGRAAVAAVQPASVTGLVAWRSVGVPDRAIAENAGWVSRAACRRSDPELFFPVPDFIVPGAAKAAKAVCAGCPVRVPCLAYALAAREKYGVWGGATEGERRAMIRAGDRRARQPRVPARFARNRGPAAK